MSTLTICVHGIDLCHDHCNLCSPRVDNLTIDDLRRRLSALEVVTSFYNAKPPPIPDTVQLPESLVREAAMILGVARDTWLCIDSLKSADNANRCIDSLRQHLTMPSGKDKA